MRINVHIERLLLEGLPMHGDQAQRLAKALQADLAHRLVFKEPSPLTRDPSLANNSNRSPHSRLPAFQADQLGPQIARSVSRSFEGLLGDMK